MFKQEFSASIVGHFLVGHRHFLRNSRILLRILASKELVEENAAK